MNPQKTNNMKKLQPKEAPKAQTWTKAHLILNNAKEEIKKFIRFEAELLYTSIYGDEPDFEEEGGWRICTGDLKEDLYINIAVDNSYLDVEDVCYERREMAEILVCLDNSVIVIDEDSNEWNDSEYTIEELAAIADLLELSYKTKFNK